MVGAKGMYLAPGLRYGLCSGIHRRFRSENLATVTTIVMSDIISHWTVQLTHS
jgi:hypothetical protein